MSQSFHNQLGVNSEGKILRDNHTPARGIMGLMKPKGTKAAQAIDCQGICVPCGLSAAWNRIHRNLIMQKCAVL